MKRCVILLPFVLTLAGCAALFDSNLYKGVDAPPALNASTLSTLSTSEIQQLASDQSFYDQLKADPAALTAVQTALNNAITNSTSTTDKIDAATTLITVTANSTEVAQMRTDAVANIQSIADYINASNYGMAFKVFLGDQTEAEINVTLTQLGVMATTLATMQTIATDGSGYVDSAVFFAAATDSVAFAETALMAAVAKAIVADKGSIAAAATELAKASPSVSGGNDMTKFGSCVGTKTTVAAGVATPGSGYSYAYAYAVKAKFSI